VQAACASAIVSRQGGRGPIEIGCWMRYSAFRSVSWRLSRRSSARDGFL